MFKRIATLSLLVSPPIFAEQIPSEVQISVFSTTAYPIQNAQLAHAIHYLDGVEQWEARFSRTLPSNPAQAEHQAKALFEAPETQNRLRELHQTYQNVIVGWQNGIRKVPAVLFEHPTLGKGVVYGENDVQKAISYWENWLNQQKREE
ncbi:MULTISPECIES: TIGR03757 family integrating conjugative element protein [Rodentibacter]|uniref:Integrating conjugative element protein n=2 Tax=Rodentibacter TaxID=1960084 RepID=A0A1V3JLJ3_9PAST|nr:MULTISPECIES: TIGR03757 family integrating conjugative element protein [Rodentibacter]OOF38283.1 integrating conjugative element protein [Rodentibacter mrazii]OOF57535.1 integrating conjugative element protein [Rodentibacter genomosp. 2]